MFKKSSPQSFDDFIQKKLINNDNKLLLSIEEFKDKSSTLRAPYEPLFNLFIQEPNKKHKVKIYENIINGYSIDDITSFIIQMQKEKFQVTYTIKSLMPQYESILTTNLEKRLEDRTKKIHITEIIKDFDEIKIQDFTNKQKNDFFLDLCCNGNLPLLQKLLKPNILNPNKTEYEYLNREDIIFALERATSYGHIEIFKELLENDVTSSIIDLSNKNKNFGDVLIWACIKKQTEILSYLLNDKQYKLDSREFKEFKQSFIDLGFSNIEQYQEKIVLNKPKM